MGMGFIWGQLGEERGARTGGPRGRGASQLAFKFSACCPEVRLSENSCRSEQRGRGKVLEGPVFLGKEVRTRIWGLGEGRRGTF